MNAQELESYCKDNGVSYRKDGEKLRVMDASQLPDVTRKLVDERGVYQQVAEAVEAPVETEVVEEEITTAKKRKSK